MKEVQALAWTFFFGSSRRELNVGGVRYCPASLLATAQYTLVFPVESPALITEVKALA